MNAQSTKNDMTKYQENKELREEMSAALGVAFAYAGYIPGVAYRTTELYRFLLKKGIPSYVFEAEYHVIHTRRLMVEKSVRLPDLLHAVYTRGVMDSHRDARRLDQCHFESMYEINKDTDLVDVYEMTDVTIFYLRKKGGRKCKRVTKL